MSCVYRLGKLLLLFLLLFCLVDLLANPALASGYIKDATGRYFKIQGKPTAPPQTSVQGSGFKPSVDLAYQYNSIIRQHIMKLNGELSEENTDAIARWILYYCAQYDVDPFLATALFSQESRFSMEAYSSTGAIGIAQLMPGTAEALGVSPYVMDQNIRGGVLYLSQMLQKFAGDGAYQSTYAIAAYNAGPQAVLSYRGVPPYKETQMHIKLVYDYYMELLGQMQ